MKPYPNRFTLFCWLCWLLASICVLMLFGQPSEAKANAFGFGPQLYKSGYTYGNGVYFAPYRLTLYTEPRQDADVIGTLQWSRRTRSNNIDITLADGSSKSAPADHVFFCFYPELDVAMMAVTGDTEDGNWVEVVYDQARRKTAWVQLKQEPKSSDSEAKTQSLAPLEGDEPVHFGVYQTWLEFMKLNAKASGIYWLSGVNEYNRSIRTSDADEAKLIPITVIRQLKVKHVRGNWLLVEVLDFERNTPLGWVRWRDDNGNLMAFPNLSGRHLPIVVN